MLKAARLSNLFGAFLILALLMPGLAFGDGAVVFKESENTVGKDIFEQNIFYEGTNFLHLDRLYRGIFHKKVRAKDINIYDEVPDNTFFTNRHGRKTLTEAELSRGYHENDGPNAAGSFTITKGHFSENKTRLFVKDASGENYLLKFDHADHVELETGAEIVASRIYYALGYNVPQNTIINIDASQLVPGEGTKVVDGTGFKKKLTPEKLEHYLMFVGQNSEGKYRVVASKIIGGELKGGYKLQGRRRNDPDDVYDHETRREIRALRVFASWLNHTDIRPENTMDALVEENGKKVLKHYLVDMDAALGADSFGSKPANFGHENFVDYGETTKAFFGLGIWEKPWQKRWKENGEKTGTTAVGYLDNNRFNPAKFKTQLPNYAFKDLTLADGFWAAKQIMNFTDGEIVAIVKSASYTEAQDADTITKILIERRDIIGRYWFSKANPLDSFDVQGSKLTFEDLAVKNNFEQAAGTTYHVDVISVDGKRGKKVTSFTSNEPSIALDSNWGNRVDLLIRVSRANSSKLSPYVRVELTDGKVSGIVHQD